MMFIPKIIENLRENLLSEARKQLFEYGYSDFNLRQIAKNCHTAVGTIYNYFSSKDMLIAGVILEDWYAIIGKMNSNCEKCTDLSCGLENIYTQICTFNEKYRRIFQESPASSAKYSFAERHEKLVLQIKGQINRVLEKFKYSTDEFIPVFIAESMLSGSAAKWRYEQLDFVFKKIIE